MVGIRRSCLALQLVALLSVVSCQSVDTSSDPRQWGEPEKIESLGSGALRADVAIDPMGNAMAVWDQTDPSTLPPNVGLEASDDIWLNREDDTGRWGGAELLERIEPDDSIFAQIEIDGDGTAVVVFLQSPAVLGDEDEAPYRVWAVRYPPDEDFREEARCIQSIVDDLECSRLDGIGDAGKPELAVDADGNTVVMWHQVEDERVSVWFNRFAADSGWIGAEAVGSPNDASDLSRPAVAMDAVGNAIAVWERLDRDVSSIWSQRLPRSGEREESQQVEIESGDARTPRVAVDPTGNAIAVWVQQQTPDAPFSTWSNRYLASTGRWGDAELIGVESEDDETKPQIAMDGAGNAIAVWAQIGGAREGIWSNRYLIDVGWETPAPVGLRNLGPARTPELAANLFGDAVAVWVQFNGVQDRVWSNRYTPSRGWSVSEAIDNNDPGRRPIGPQVAVDPQGNAVAVWMDSPGQLNWDLWANRLSASAPGSDTR